MYRKIKETVNYITFSKSHEYTYYKNSTIHKFTEPYELTPTHTYTYTYDNLNRLSSIELPNILGGQSGGYITYNTYDWIRPTLTKLPGGATKIYEHDIMMRIKSLNHKDPAGNSLLDYTHTYDKMSNLIDKTTDSDTSTYIYDKLYRLKEAYKNGTQTEDYTYDKLGNRLTDQNNNITPWSYNLNNELGLIPTPTDPITFQYDSNGNLTQKNQGSQTTTYTYNLSNRLSSISDGTNTTYYYYDPFGRRLWKNVNGTKTYYHYNNQGLIAEYNSNGTEFKTYGYKPYSNWTTNPLFMKFNGEYFYYHNDHMGTPQKITRSNGEIVWSATFMAFGKAQIEESLIPEFNNLRLPGQYYDSESDLHYNLNRYYDPSLGRYTSSDPIYKDSMNLYQYANNNPNTYMDPHGLSTKDAVQIYERLQELVKIMNENGDRCHDNPLKNNWRGGKDCGSLVRTQAESLDYNNDWVLDFPDYTVPYDSLDDEWVWDEHQYPIVLFGHQWNSLQNTTPNNNDPIIHTDPWYFNEINFIWRQDDWMNSIMLTHIRVPKTSWDYPDFGSVEWVSKWTVQYRGRTIFESEGEDSIDLGFMINLIKMSISLCDSSK